MPSSASIKHIRHAVSIDEDQKILAPILLRDNISSNSLSRNSLVEAWFVGTHLDVGGGARDDGLSLYPLQWMLIESKAHGLCLEERRTMSQFGISPRTLSN